MKPSPARPVSCWKRAVRLTLCSLLPIGAVPSSVSALELGKPAPAFEAPRLAGSGTVSLEDYRGKVVYLDFWASWCTPCLTALPQIEQMRREFPEKDFQVVAVNVDRDPAAARRFLKKRPIGYPSASDPEGRLPERFELGTMPTSFLIDRQGRIRHIHEGFRSGDLDALKERIRTLVATKE